MEYEKRNRGSTEVLRTPVCRIWRVAVGMSPCAMPALCLWSPWGFGAGWPQLWRLRNRRAPSAQCAELPNNLSLLRFLIRVSSASGGFMYRSFALLRHPAESRAGAQDPDSLRRDGQPRADPGSWASSETRRTRSSITRV